MLIRSALGIIGAVLVALLAGVIWGAGGRLLAAALGVLSVSLFVMAILLRSQVTNRTKG